MTKYENVKKIKDSLHHKVIITCGRWTGMILLELNMK